MHAPDRAYSWPVNRPKLGWPQLVAALLVFILGVATHSLVGCSNGNGLRKGSPDASVDLHECARTPASSAHVLLADKVFRSALWPEPSHHASAQRQIALTAWLVTHRSNRTVPQALTPLTPYPVMTFRLRRWTDFFDSSMTPVNQTKIAHTPVNQTKTAQQSSLGTNVWPLAGSVSILPTPLRSRQRWTNCASHS